MTMRTDVSLEDYHASKSISHSKMKDLASRGPHYYAARHVTKTTTPDVDGDAFLFGQIFEDIAQGRGVDLGTYAVKPAGMTFATKEGKAWRAEAVAAGKRIVSADELAIMAEMADAIRENGTAVQMIRSCTAQATLECAYPGTPGLQARPDWISIDGCAASTFTPFTIDLKTTKSLDDLVSGRGVLKYGYHSQAAFVRYLMRAELAASASSSITLDNPSDARFFVGLDHGYSAHFLLACEKQRPYRCQLIEVPNEWLDIGWAWCERMIARLKKHYESDAWPRVECDMVKLPPPPAWADRVVSDDGEDE